MSFTYEGSWYKSVVQWILTDYHIHYGGILTSADALVGMSLGVHSIAS